MYRVGEFAKQSGVSVRTLHHYDRIGLLKPSGRTESGYRLYTHDDLLRVQQILTLRFLGFPLTRIRALLDRPDFDLVASLRVQQDVLRERISELERIAAVLDTLTRERITTGTWDWDLVTRASREVQGSLNERGIQMEARFTPEQMQRFAELDSQLAPGEREGIEQRWTALIAEVQANRHLEPASPEAQALAERWNALTAETHRSFADRGYNDLWNAVGDNMRAGNFPEQQGVPISEDFAFIQRVNATRETGPAT